MVSAQADVFIKVEHLDLGPVDVGQGRQRIEKLKLRTTRGGEEAATALLRDDAPEDFGRMVRRSGSERVFVGVTFQVHVGKMRFVTGSSAANGFSESFRLCSCRRRSGKHAVGEIPVLGPVDEIQIMDTFADVIMRVITVQ